MENARPRRKRKRLSVKLRFEVFKRDSFKCQYCGRAAPEVVLEIEHVQPHSKGGDDNILNLLTSCWECNSGKGDRELSDHTVLKKQRDQLAELQARREQLDMMIEWRKGNADLDAHAVQAFADAYSSRVTGYYLNENGLVSARKLIKKFGLQRALDALDRAADALLEFKDGQATPETAARVLRYTYVLAEPEEIQALYKIRARIRHRWNYVHDGIAIALLRKVHAFGVSIDDIDAECTQMIGVSGSSFRYWQQQMEDWILQLREAASHGSSP